MHSMYFFQISFSFSHFLSSFTSFFDFFSYFDAFSVFCTLFYVNFLTFYSLFSIFLIFPCVFSLFCVVFWSFFHLFAVFSSFVRFSSHFSIVFSHFSQYFLNLCKFVTFLMDEKALTFFPFISSRPTRLGIVLGSLFSWHQFFFLWNSLWNKNQSSRCCRLHSGFPWGREGVSYCVVQIFWSVECKKANFRTRKMCAGASD